MVETHVCAQMTRKSEARFLDVAGANQPLIPPDPPCPSGVGVTRWGGFLRPTGESSRTLAHSPGSELTADKQVPSLPMRGTALCYTEVCSLSL